MKIKSGRRRQFPNHSIIENLRTATDKRTNNHTQTADSTCILTYVYQTTKANSVRDRRKEIGADRRRVSYCAG